MDALSTTPPPALRQLLQKCFSDTILDCSMSAGSNPGDNVIGKMLAVKVATSSGNKYDLVVKASIPFRSENEPGLTHEERLFARLIAVFGSFRTELAYYQRIQPGVKALHTTDLSLPVPTIYIGQDDEENDGFNACLILEDLRPKGYKMANKMKGLTWDEVFMVLEKIAKFHAASYVYLQKNQINTNEETDADPLSMHVFKSTARIGAEKAHQDFALGLCNDMLELGRESKAITEDMYRKISEWTKDPRKVILSSSKQASVEYFPVVIHGDLWVNNILFKYDDQGKPVDVRFIDFQQCRYSSVFDELHYFLYTSTTAEFRRKNLDECLKFYFETFHDTLKSVSATSKENKTIAKFTHEAFLEGYRKFLGAAFCYGVIAIPFQLGIPAPPASVDESKTELKADEAKNEAKSEAEHQSTSGPSSDHCDLEELRNFTADTLQGMRTGLIPAAERSPEALKRFGEFCQEMDEMGVFK